MIRITQREHLLHCIVPAATVRLEVEAAGIGDRVVPAESGCAGLRKWIAGDLRKARGDLSYAKRRGVEGIVFMMQGAIGALLRLSDACAAKPTKQTLGGNSVFNEQETEQ